MSKERELLERAYYVLGELSYAMLKDSGEYSLAGDIYEFLSTPEPTQDEEPVAWFSQTSRTFSTVETSHHTAPLFLHPAPRPEFVRLSEEEIMDLSRAEGESFRWPSSAISIARAIEDALEERNK